MRPLESLAARCRISGVMLLFAALIAIDAHAAAPREHAPPWAVADAVAASHRASAMGDCMPCVYCNAGPASTVQGFSGESKEREEPAWTALARRAPSRQRSFASAQTRRSPVPVRIAYCRWSN